MKTNEIQLVNQRRLYFSTVSSILCLPEFVFTSVNLRMILQAAFGFQNFSAFITREFRSSFLMDKLHMTLQAVFALDQFAANFTRDGGIRSAL